MQATTQLSEQTKVDLNSILETLDQRIHETTSDRTVSEHEGAALCSLRDAAQVVLEN
jgi:hypothetical protein